MQLSNTEVNQHNAMILHKLNIEVSSVVRVRTQIQWIKPPREQVSLHTDGSLSTQGAAYIFREISDTHFSTNFLTGFIDSIRYKPLSVLAPNIIHLPLQWIVRSERVSR